MHFMAVKKLRNRSGFVIYSYLKDSVFTAFKWDAKFYTRYVKGAPLVNRRYTKGEPFVSKMVYKRVRGCTLGRSPPDKTWLSTPGGSSNKGAKRRSSNRMDKGLGSIFILSYFKTLNIGAVPEIEPVPQSSALTTELILPQ